MSAIVRAPISGRRYAREATGDPILPDSPKR
jgi:hypothetical protein